MSAPVRVALVGLGWWGRKMLAVLDGADSLVVVRLVDPDPAAAAIAEARNLPLTAELDDALSDPAVEAVVLATPHSLHEMQVARTVAAGKHVFCEKPLALTRAGAARAVAACSAAGLVLGIGHERRWEPPVAALLGMAAAGELGRIHQIEANFSHDRFLALDPNNWRLTAEEAPAGGMTATGIHLLDLSVRLLGPAASVLCHCERLSSNLPQGDTVAAYTQFRGGGTAYISASLANPFLSRITVIGRNGWIDIRDKAHVETPEGWVVTRGLVGHPITIEEVGPAEPVRDNLIAFAGAVRGAQTYPISGAEIIDTAALLEAISRSAGTGQLEAVE
jgi:predicted dehydrogenase